MPTYQYACKDCDYHFEQVQAFSDPSLTVCPNCAGHLRKVYGSVGVVFKGSGFYRTDSRSGSDHASLSASTDSAKSSDGTSTSKVDAGAKKDSSAKKADSGAKKASPAKAPAAAAS